MRTRADAEQRLSRLRLLRLALLGLAGAGVLTIAGLMLQSASAPAAADEGTPSGSPLGSIVHSATGAVGALTSSLGATRTPQNPSDPGLLGTAVKPVTTAVDTLVSALPGDTVGGILGTSPTGSITAPVLGTVDQIVGDVTGIVTGGSTGTTSPSNPSTPATPPGSGTPAAPQSPATPPAGSDLPVPAIAVGATPVPAADPSVAAPAPLVTPSVSRAAWAVASAAASALPTPPSASIALPTVTAVLPAGADGSAMHGDALAGSGASGASAVADVDGSWSTPPQPSSVTDSPPQNRPANAPPGEHDVSPG
ncbi:hypothetical protein [Leifsonia sp. 2MCAF36]|uniref:hypothetical protein n=1 Tax=Leifsonia sp. 2MCAF36 TaxID=3232988 RepID=UPI003F9CDF75